MEYLDCCPICASKTLELVYKWNNFQSSPGCRSTWPKEWQRSDYTLCHTCGVLFARRRQSDSDYSTYYHAFENSGRKTEWFATAKPSEKFVADQEADAADVLERLAAAKVIPGKSRALVLRADCGSSMRRLRDDYGVKEVFGLDYFAPNLEFAREKFGLTNLGNLSSLKLEVPFPGKFDLVLSNHQLMHAFHPRPLLEKLRELLTDDGHLVVYNEDNQAVVFRDQPLPYHWGVVNNFHKQLFTARSLANTLKLYGLSPDVRERSPDTLFAVCTKCEPVPVSDIPKDGFDSLAVGMRRVGRRFAFLQWRWWLVWATGLRHIKQWLQ